MIDIKIEGLNELKKKLDELAPKMEKKIVGQALRQGTNVIRDSARSKVNSISGNLKKSIKTVGVKGKKPLVSEMNVRVRGKDAFYAKFVEFGTKPHVILPKKGMALLVKGKEYRIVHHPGAVAKPFMRPAFDENYQKAIDRFKEVVSQKLSEVVK